MVCAVGPREQHLLPEDDEAIERQDEIRLQHVRRSDSIGMVGLASPEEGAFSLLFRPTGAGHLQVSVQAARLSSGAKAQRTGLPRRLKDIEHVE